MGPVMSDPPGRKEDARGRNLSSTQQPSGRAGRVSGMEWIARQMHGNAMRDAAEMMAWRGYEKVQAWELARAAHISVGTMYRQYGNKRNFALEVRRFTEQELCMYAEQ